MTDQLTEYITFMMKKLLIIAIALCVQAVAAQEADIKKSIGVFFEGLHTADTLKMQSVCSKSLVLHSVSDTPKGIKFVDQPTSEFYKSIASIPKDMKVEERLLSYNIQIDGSMAHVWTPYEFYVNGKLSHAGVNSFQMFKDKDVWKIVHIIDTRRKK